MKAVLFLTILGLLLAIPDFSFANPDNSLGGYMLMMTSETQKEAQRTVGYAAQDIQVLQTQLDQLLYIRKRRRMIKRDNIRLDNETKENITKVSMRLSDHFDKLSNTFKSIYFIDGADDSYKKHFDSIKGFRQDLKTPAKEIDVEFLYDLHAQNREVQFSVDHIRSFIHGAQIQTQAYIQDKLHKMSVWQWLFGY